MLIGRKNELKGWGFNFVSLANVSNEAASEDAANAAAAAMVIVATA